MTRSRRDRSQVIIATVLVVLLALTPLGLALLLGSDLLQAIPWTLVIAVAGVVLVIWLHRRGRTSA
jgi:hypothetical protein